jgi:hypothetical protein
MATKVSTTPKVLSNATRVGIVSNPDTNNKSYVNRGGYGYIINSMFLIALVGMCIKIFFTSKKSADGTTGPANSVIYGYGLVAMSILTVMFISYAIHSKVSSAENNGKVVSIINFLKSFLTSSAPSVLTILLLLWFIALNMTYYKRINKGMVATEYYQLSSGTSFLFIFQIICLFQYLKLYIESNIKLYNVKSEAKNKIEETKNRIAFATYFITAINLIIAGIMTIILEFFSTDG